MSPQKITRYTMPPPLPLKEECLWLIDIHLLLAYLLCYCQSIDLVITINSFYWVLLSKSPLSQSEALLNKSRCALLECAIHVFNSVSLCPPFLLWGGGGGSERDS